MKARNCLALGTALVLAACGGGGGTEVATAPPPAPPAPPPPPLPHRRHHHHRSLQRTSDWSVPNGSRSSESETHIRWTALDSIRHC